MTRTEEKNNHEKHKEQDTKKREKKTKRKIKEKASGDSIPPEKKEEAEISCSQRRTSV